MYDYGNKVYVEHGCAHLSAVWSGVPLRGIRRNVAFRRSSRRPVASIYFPRRKGTRGYAADTIRVKRPWNKLIIANGQFRMYTKTVVMSPVRPRTLSCRPYLARRTIDGMKTVRFVRAGRSVSTNVYDQFRVPTVLTEISFRLRPRRRRIDL